MEGWVAAVIAAAVALVGVAYAARTANENIRASREAAAAKERLDRWWTTTMWVWDNRSEIPKDVRESALEELSLLARFEVQSTIVEAVIAATGERRRPTHGPSEQGPSERR